jgi:hypothetical protein
MYKIEIRSELQMSKAPTPALPSATHSSDDSAAIMQDGVGSTTLLTWMRNLSM